MKAKSNLRNSAWTSSVILMALSLIAPEMQAQKSSTKSGDSAAPVVKVDAEYKVGAGDLIEVSVWKEPEVSSTIVVRPDGKISLPLINDFLVSGMTPTEIQNLVTEKLTPFIKAPSVTVTVKEIRSKKVYVLGQVSKAGAYEVHQPTTVLQILTEAGGLGPFAKQKSIYVLRNEGGGQKRLGFNYKDVVKGKNMAQNVMLVPGDTVVVP